MDQLRMPEMAQTAIIELRAYIHPDGAVSHFELRSMDPDEVAHQLVMLEAGGDQRHATSHAAGRWVRQVIDELP